jgi:hypothetical protein
MMGRVLQGAFLVLCLVSCGGEVEPSIDFMPIVTFAGQQGGSIESTDFKKHRTLVVSDNSCTFKSCNLFYRAGTQDRVEFTLTSAILKGIPAVVVNSASPTNTYTFANIKLTCGENSQVVKVARMVFTIK